MSPLSAQIPPGWYPDPAGQRQWRVWNGSAWSDVTRPYGESVAVPATPRIGVAELTVLGSLRHLSQFGILAYYTGFALLTGLVAHWPGRVDPVSPRVASATLGAAIGLTLIGAISFAACVRALRGRWTLDALLPIINTFAAALWMSRFLGLTKPSPRILIDALLTMGFVVLCPTQPWVGIALASVAFNQLLRTYALTDQLSGPAQRAP